MMMTMMMMMMMMIMMTTTTTMMMMMMIMMIIENVLVWCKDSMATTVLKPAKQAKSVECLPSLRKNIQTNAMI